MEGRNIRIALYSRRRTAAGSSGIYKRPGKEAMLVIAIFLISVGFVIFVYT